MTFAPGESYVWRGAYTWGKADAAPFANVFKVDFGDEAFVSYAHLGAIDARVTLPYVSANDRIDDAPVGAGGVFIDQNAAGAGEIVTRG